MNADSNPYASPADVSRGEYDHSLFWTILKVACVLILFFLILDAIAITWLSVTRTPQEVLRCILFDWR